MDVDASTLKLFRKTIGDEFTRVTEPVSGKGHDSCWDFIKTDQGRFFFSVCGEASKPLNVMVYEFFPDDCTCRKVFDLEDEFVLDHAHMTHSKIHTSMDVLRDGKIIMTTHNTAPSPYHDRWLLEQAYEDMWEGFPGSLVLILDPNTDDVKVKGIPVPRESLYGAILGQDKSTYYMSGHAGGHLYALNLDTLAVRDFGKVAEKGASVLAVSKQGKIFSTTATGRVWCFDPLDESIEYADIQFRCRYEEIKAGRQVQSALVTADGTIILVSGHGHMIMFDPVTMKLVHEGFMEDNIPHLPMSRNIIPGHWGLAQDENGVLYYGHKRIPLSGGSLRLIRWDYWGGGVKENLGVVAVGTKFASNAVKMLFDDKGRLHIANSNLPYSPAIFSVDIKKAKTGRRSFYLPEDFVKKELNLRLPSPATDQAYYDSFMRVDKVSILPIFDHVAITESKTNFAFCADDRLVHFIMGKTGIFRMTYDSVTEKIIACERILDDARVTSAIVTQSKRLFLLTSDFRLLEGGGNSLVEKFKTTEAPPELAKFVACIDEENVLCLSRDGVLLVLDCGTKQTMPIADAPCLPQDAYAVPYGQDELLFSDTYGNMFVFSAGNNKVSRLDRRTPGVKGRAFRSYITGGVELDCRTVVAGTRDGTLFCFDPKTRARVSYGRIFSTGMLRGFVRQDGDNVLCVYGGDRDMARILRFSKSNGLVDLGRIEKKDYRFKYLDYDDFKDWRDFFGYATINVVSNLVYVRSQGKLIVTSRENYGSVFVFSNFSAT